ncbi:uncharacterized protein N7515_008019 [Penicillium bovifimosum]|uniref:Uncharacterized protein n=1 Tax=Penicillium bovifimosum TaxID=126998 RepID=A0A9W9KVY5_9EURO|nr:uncharacterized protein N7515_008019 [Penicillium bovifimosum]KAJ5124194.1 hypothetical protein N7515_008019 [Penicillium bovifimosum]
MPQTRSSGPPGGFDSDDAPAENSHHHDEAGPSVPAIREPISAQDKGKAPAGNVPTDDQQAQLQALSNEINDLRARLSSYDHRSVDTPIQSTEMDYGMQQSVYPPAVHFAPTPAFARAEAHQPRREALPRSESPRRGVSRSESPRREPHRREDSTFTGPMDDHPVPFAEDEQLAIQFIRNHQSPSKLFKNRGMSTGKITPLSGRANYKEWSIDVSQYFTAKFMRELLTGKAGNLPEDHKYYTYLETLKTIDDTDSLIACAPIVLSVSRYV